MQRFQQRCDTAESWRAGHNPGQAVLNALQLVYFSSVIYMCTEDTQGPPISFEASIYHQAYHQSYQYLRPLDESGSPGDDSENLYFVAPLDTVGPIVDHYSPISGPPYVCSVAHRWGTVYATSGPPVSH